MKENLFEMNTFDGETICFEYKSIIVCNNSIKKAILEDGLDIGAPKPFIIIARNDFDDHDIFVLKDASIADYLKFYRSKPAFGGIIL